MSGLILPSGGGRLADLSDIDAPADAGLLRYDAASETYQHATDLAARVTTVEATVAAAGSLMYHDFATNGIAQGAAYPGAIALQSGHYASVTGNAVFDTTGLTMPSSVGVRHSLAYPVVSSEVAPRLFTTRFRHPSTGGNDGLETAFSQGTAPTAWLCKLGANGTITIYEHPSFSQRGQYVAGYSAAARNFHMWHDGDPTTQTAAMYLDGIQVFFSATGIATGGYQIAHSFWSNTVVMEAFRYEILTASTMPSERFVAP